ncbi:MAG: diguanylate cyclase, partial [Spirochaetes bacterium]|nr:diguanylate cyclase [Spirochaetota bacterium]
VVDYVIKESSHTLDYVISVIKRINQNRTVNILVVDDSVLFRTRIRDLLRVHMYNVIEAANGVEAMSVLNSGRVDIRMVITDFNMPQMDGFQLIDEIRKKYTREQLAIVGISGNNTLSARFIKHGANDFINKEFFSEEFYCRITQNIEMLEYIRLIKEASNTDYLTGLYNRRYFFELGSKLYANAKREHLELTVSMIDIDYFKKINDTYGHDAGDLVLQKLALSLKSRFRESDIVCRFGGEEFCIMMCNMGNANSQNIFEELRKKIDSIKINIGDETIKITVSIGICSKLMSSLYEMIKMADAMLYQAKEEGRNRIKSIG